MNPAEISANAPNQQTIVRLVERRRWTCISQQQQEIQYVVFVRLMYVLRVEGLSLWCDRNSTTVTASCSS